MRKILIGLMVVGTILFANSDLDKQEEVIKKKLSIFLQSLTNEESELLPFYLKKYYTLIDKCSSLDLDNIKKLPLDENFKKDADKVEEVYKNNSILYLCLQNEYFNIVLKRTNDSSNKKCYNN
jgi:fructose-bisphosphate aldolase class 1